jgi:hypothetical protein
VWSPALGRHVAVGDEADAPDAPEFICDGFHFVNADGGPDLCAAAGDACWCGQHRDAPPPAAAAKTPAPASPALPSGALAGLLGKENS